MFTLFYIMVITEKTRYFVVFYWFSGCLLFWGSLNTWCNLIKADFNISSFGMFSFQTKYLTCLSSIDGDDPKKSVNHTSKSENQMEKSENQTYRRESCDRFSRVHTVWQTNLYLIKLSNPIRRTHWTMSCDQSSAYLPIFVIIGVPGVILHISRPIER